MDGIRQIIKEKVCEWKDLDNQQILLERMTGLTNQIYKVSAPNRAPIIFRKFGDATQNVFLERESQVYVYLHISQIGLGPKVYYFDEQIRIEQFLQSTLLPSNCMLQEEYVEKVGFTLSKFHQLKPASQKIKKQSLFRRVFVNQRKAILEVCHKKMAQDIFTEQQKELVALFKQWVFEDQLNFIEEIIQKSQSQELVFSHNDLLSNNILIQKETDDLIFIDYEYASYNFPIYDIANYICESEFNYNVDQPPYFSLNILKPEDFQKQLRLIEAYVVGKDLSHEEFKANFETLRKEGKYQAEINHLVSQLPLGMMLHHLLWGWWGIIVCKNPNIQFDYIAFVKRRYDEYHRLKAIVTK